MMVIREPKEEPPLGTMVAGTGGSSGLLVIGSWFGYSVVMGGDGGV